MIAIDELFSTSEFEGKPFKGERPTVDSPEHQALRSLLKTALPNHHVPHDPEGCKEALAESDEMFIEIVAGIYKSKMQSGV